MIRTLAPVRSVRNVTLTQSSIQMLSSLASNDLETSLVLYFHADTCVIGKYSLILNDYERTVTVYGYDRDLGAQFFCPQMTGQIGRASCHLWPPHK